MKREGSVAYERFSTESAKTNASRGSFFEVRAISLHVHKDKAEGNYYTTDMRTGFDDVLYRDGEMGKYDACKPIVRS